jgi:hypothetical protein
MALSGALIPKMDVNDSGAGIIGLLRRLCHLVLCRIKQPPNSLTGVTGTLNFAGSVKTPLRHAVTIAGCVTCGAAESHRLEMREMVLAAIMTDVNITRGQIESKCRRR